MSTAEPTEKKCSKCGETKPPEAFCRARKSPGGRHCWCRVCTKAWRVANRERMNAYTRKYIRSEKGKDKRRARARRRRQTDPVWHERRKKATRERKRYLRRTHPHALRLQAVKSEPCIDCGVTYPAEIMELDHVRGIKCFPVTMAQVVRPTVSTQAFEAELAKCDVRCPTCHRLRHYHARTIGRPLSKAAC